MITGGLKKTTNKLGILLILTASFFLVGCTGETTTTVSTESVSFTIPNEFQEIAPSTLDKTQIIHTILGAWKTENDNLVLASSAAPENISLKEFAEKASTRLSQEMIGYTSNTINQKTFTCNGKKKTGYLHSFAKTNFKDNSIIDTYYNQFYFIEDDTLYILSLAQKEKKAIVNNIITSLGCINK